MSHYFSLPTNPGVYIFKDKNDKIIYIGKANNIKKRVASYFSNKVNLDPKTQQLLSHIYSIDHILVGSEIEAFLLEANLIKKNKPFYNIQFKDDKFYPYIKVGNFKSRSNLSAVPYITIARKKDEKNALYFGRYPNATSVKIVLKLLRRIFPYQSVKNHTKRNCLYYHLNLCPCVPAHPEHLAEYRKTIKKIEDFLRGKKDRVISALERERDSNAKREEFEKAKAVQEKIDRINIITSSFYHPFRYEKDPEFYHHRIKNELESLKKILIKYYKNINELNRIECYDISNISGTNATGSMVVFINGEEDKAQYRRFKIKSKTTPDDYAMMQEVLRRRLKHADWDYPDLIVIDGGKGQVSASYHTLFENKLDIPIIGLAKREEIIVIPLLENRELMFFEEKLPISTPGVNLLRRIRDEAHRFAINYHRLLRKKYLTNLE